MDRIHKNRWIKALRSGLYIGGATIPRIDDKWNVFGILYDINLHILNTKWVTSNKDPSFWLWIYKNEAQRHELVLEFLNKIDLYGIDLEKTIFNISIEPDLDVCADWIEKNL